MIEFCILAIEPLNFFQTREDCDQFRIANGASPLLRHHKGHVSNNKDSCSMSRFPHHNFFVYVLMIMEFRTDVELYVSYQGGSKHGRHTFGISYEDCYAREISRFVCNICLR